MNMIVVAVEVGLGSNELTFREQRTGDWRKKCACPPDARHRRVTLGNTSAEQLRHVEMAELTAVDRAVARLAVDSKLIKYRNNKEASQAKSRLWLPNMNRIYIYRVTTSSYLIRWPGSST